MTKRAQVWSNNGSNVLPPPLLCPAVASEAADEEDDAAEGPPRNENVRREGSRKASSSCLYKVESTESTSTAMRLNSSRQHHAPEPAMPLRMAVNVARRMPSLQL